MEPGVQYTLRITTDGTTPEGGEPLLCLYCYTDVAENEAGALLNGDRQAFDWAAVVEYGEE